MRLIDQLMDVELKGGPDWIPATVSVCLSDLAKGRLRIPFQTVNDLFVYDCYVKKVDGERSLRVLCGTTEVVE